MDTDVNVDVNMECNSKASEKGRTDEELIDEFIALLLSQSIDEAKQMALSSIVAQLSNGCHAVCIDQSTKNNQICVFSCIFFSQNKGYDDPSTGTQGQSKCTTNKQKKTQKKQLQNTNFAPCLRIHLTQIFVRCPRDCFAHKQQQT
jgi:hypothetical protein